MQDLSISEAVHILDLSRPMSHEEIRKAYRNKARKLHPDLFQDETEKENATQKFINLKAACDLLLAFEEYELNDPVQMRKNHLKARAEALKRQVVLPDWSLMYDWENAAKLFNSRGSALKWMSKLKLEKRFKSVRQFIHRFNTFWNSFTIGDRAYGVLKFFRLILFAVIFTAYALGLSIGFVLLVLLILPASLLFIFTYFLLQKFSTHNLKVKTGKKTIHAAAIYQHPKAVRKYLFLRTFIWPIVLLAGSLLFLISHKIYMLFNMSLFSILWLSIMFSIIYEWREFNKINQLKNQ